MVRGLLIDVGGVLVANHWPGAARVWAARLRISEQAFMVALFGGNDAHVLVGRMSEAEWWEVVRGRLDIGPDLLDELRNDLAHREVWDRDLVAVVRCLRPCARTAIVSNTWPELRTRMSSRGLLDIVDEVVLSCEVGYAKPNRRIFQVALERIAVQPEDALFVDDTAGHVAVARSLGMRGHVHEDVLGTIGAIDRFMEGAPDGSLTSREVLSASAKRPRWRTDAC